MRLPEPLVMFVGTGVGCAGRLAFGYGDCSSLSSLTI